MFRFALGLVLSLAVSAVSVGQTPDDPKPLAQRVASLEARIAKLERLLAIQSAAAPAATVEVAPATTYSRSTQETCTGPGCSTGGGLGTRSGPIRRLLGR